LNAAGVARLLLAWLRLPPGFNGKHKEGKRKMERQKNDLADKPKRLVADGGTSQPELAHRMLTAEEAQAIWAILRAAALPEDCQEVRIGLPLDDDPQTRGWIIYTNGTGADLTLVTRRKL
jgi:hypothetical protein